MSCGKTVGWGAVLGATFSGSDLSGGEFSTFDWRAANFTHCDLTNSELGDLDIRRVDLQGVKLDNYGHRCSWNVLASRLLASLQGAVNIPPPAQFFTLQASLKSGVWKFSTLYRPMHK